MAWTQRVQEVSRQIEPFLNIVSLALLDYYLLVVDKSHRNAKN